MQAGLDAEGAGAHDDGDMPWQRPEEEQSRGPYDARLDFCSPTFDALLALTTAGVEPPDPHAQPLDYLAKCRVLLPPEMEVRAAQLRVARALARRGVCC
jgi:hypothetical protein